MLYPINENTEVPKNEIWNSPEGYYAIEIKYQV